MQKHIKKIVTFILALLVSGYYLILENPNNFTKPSQSIVLDEKVDNKVLIQLINQKQSDKVITLNAKVIKLLADDLDGDKHQKMIIEIGQNTLLLAHNIDKAPRVPVVKGDMIIVRGEYQYNELGGVIHWTHHSSNSHPAGWIKYKNKKYD